MSRPVPMLDRPDPRRRPAKARWRQVHALVVQELETSFAELASSTMRVAVATDVDGLARTLDREDRLRVEAFDVDADVPGEPAAYHAAVVTHPEVLPVPERMRLLRRFVVLLRPAGRLVVLADVVRPWGSDPAAHDPPWPTCSTLLEQLDRASGQELMVEDIRSVRWGREPVRRGAVISMRRLGTSVRW